MKKLNLNLIGLLAISFCLISSSGWAAITTLYATSDTKLNPSATTTNYDTETSTGSAASDNTAILFKFDIGSTGIAAADVVSADLRIYGESRGFQHEMTVYRALRNWVSNQATWNIYSTGNNWGTSGATNSSSDYTTSHSATGDVPDNDYVTIDVTDIVKDMITSGNYYGFIMRPTAGSMYQTWRTSEYSGTTYDPRLTIRTAVAGVPTQWYLRADGGTCTGEASTECTGNANAAYDGSGTVEACACESPAEVAALMQGEDVVNVKAGDVFSISTMPTFPAGSTDELVTQIHGEGWDSNCSNPPVFSGANNGTVMTIGGNTEINCLKITDSNGCLTTKPAGAGGRIDNNGSQDFIACADGSTGAAKIGLKLVNGSSGVYLLNTTIAGMGDEGMQAYEAGNITAFNFHILGSGYVGWSGGNPPLGNYTGTVNFINSSIKYTGCGWRAKATSGGAAAGTPHNCYSQDQSGYGDAIGANAELGNWNVIGSEISYNVSDGFDHLYDPDSVIYMNRYRAEGNAGAGLKSESPSVTIENSFIKGNCPAWAASPWVYASINAPGRSGSSCDSDGICDANENWTNCSADCTAAFNVCRPANMTALSLSCRPGVTFKILNSTLGSNGDTIVFINENDTGCSSSEEVYIRNSIFTGGTQYNGGESNISDFTYSEKAGGDHQSGGAITINEDHNLICGTKTWNTDCTGSNSICQSSCSGVFSGTLNDFTPGYFTGTNYIDEHYLHASSPALNEADESVTLQDGSADVNNSPRGAAWDLGALESGSTPVSCSPTGQTCINDFECCSQTCTTGVCASGGSSGPVVVTTGAGKITIGGGKISL